MFYALTLRLTEYLNFTTAKFSSILASISSVCKFSGTTKSDIRSPVALIAGVLGYFLLQLVID